MPSDEDNSYPTLLTRLRKQSNNGFLKRQKSPQLWHHLPNFLSKHSIILSHLLPSMQLISVFLTFSGTKLQIHNWKSFSCLSTIPSTIVQPLPWHSRELILNHIHFLYISAANLTNKHRLPVGHPGFRICVVWCMLSLVSLPGPDGLSDAFPRSGAIGVCLRKVLKILKKVPSHICPCPFYFGYRHFLYCCPKSCSSFLFLNDYIHF